MAERPDTYAEILIELFDTTGVDQESAQRRKELQIRASALWAQRINQTLTEETTVFTG